METTVYNFHDDNNEFAGKLQLRGGDDAEKAKWIDLTPELDLFASHADFLYKIARDFNASI